MHDPDAVLFDLHLPLPRVKWKVVGRQERWEFRRRRYTGERLRGQPIRQWWRPDGYTCHIAGRVLGLVPLVTVWHREPDGRDSGDVRPARGTRSNATQLASEYGVTPNYITQIVRRQYRRSA